MKNNKIIILGKYSWDRTTHYLNAIHSSDIEEALPDTRLTNKQKALLCCLADAYPSPLNNLEIIHKVWGSQHISPESLPQLINRTRKVLGDSEKTVLKNIPNVGYILEFEYSKTQTPSLEAESINTDVVVPETRIHKSTGQYLMTLTVLAAFMVTIFNIVDFYSAYSSKKQFIEARFSVPYQRIENNTDNMVKVILDDAECKYEKNSQTLDCR